MGGHGTATRKKSPRIEGGGRDKVEREGYQGEWASSPASGAGVQQRPFDRTQVNGPHRGSNSRQPLTSPPEGRSRLPRRGPNGLTNSRGVAAPGSNTASPTLTPRDGGAHRAYTGGNRFAAHEEGVPKREGCALPAGRDDHYDARVRNRRGGPGSRQRIPLPNKTANGGGCARSSMPPSGLQPRAHWSQREWPGRRSPSAKAHPQRPASGWWRQKPQEAFS